MFGRGGGAGTARVAYRRYSPNVFIHRMWESLLQGRDGRERRGGGTTHFNTGAPTSLACHNIFGCLMLVGKYPVLGGGRGGVYFEPFVVDRVRGNQALSDYWIDKLHRRLRTRLIW